MLCHGLWNNTSKVVAFNRELLSLNARLSTGKIQKSCTSMTFVLHNASTGELVLEGRLNKSKRISPRANSALITHMGLKQAWRITRQTWVSMKVVNPVGVLFSQNLTTETLARNDSNVVRFYDPHVDKIIFGDTPYRELGFLPQLFQYMDGIKFVYPNPPLKPDESARGIKTC